MKKIKPSYDEHRTALGKVLPLDTPFNVIIDTSEACNFKCKYCFRAESDKNYWGYAKEESIMSWELFTEIIEQLKEFPNKIRQISLSNHGEPLFNKRIPDMVRYIKSSQAADKVSIHTNASLLNKELAIDLADSEIDKIVVSLQGLDPESYKDMCGVRIDFPFFYDNLRMLYRYKKNTEISIKIMRTALGRYTEKDFYQKFYDISDRVFVEEPVPIWKVPNNNENNSNKSHNKYGQIIPLQECCPVIFHTIVITPTGDIYPCTQLLSDNCLGNVRDYSLYQCWNSKERRQLLRSQLCAEDESCCRSCYIKQNSIFTQEDMIDDFKDEILDRLL